MDTNVAPLSTAELVEAVKEHARQHYDDSGWDMVAEAYTDEDLADVIGKASTVQGAIRNVGEFVSQHAGRNAAF